MNRIEIMKIMQIMKIMKKERKIKTMNVMKIIKTNTHLMFFSVPVNWQEPCRIIGSPRLASPGLIKGNTLEKVTLGAMFFIKMPRPELSSRSMTILQFGHLNVLLPPIFVWRNPQAEQVCVVYSSPTIKRPFSVLFSLFFDKTESELTWQDFCTSFWKFYVSIPRWHHVFASCLGLKIPARE